MTRILMAGGVAALSVAVVVGQTSQPTSTSRPASSPVARPQTAPPAPAPAKSVAPTGGEDAATSRALVDQYCVTCHNARLKTGGLVLDKDQLDFARLADHTELAEKVVRKVRAGLMPPTNSRRPDAATMESFLRFMETSLDANASQHLPAPGLHRLNRTEYAICFRSKWTLPSSCRRTTRRAGSTTSPAL